MRFFAVCLFLCLASSGAWAACSSPPGNGGDITWNGTNAVIWCDGSTWYSLRDAVNTATPAAGSTGHIQFNNSNAFATDTALFWDNTNKRLGLGTATPVARLDVRGAVWIEGNIRIGNGAVPLIFDETDRAAGTPGKYWRMPLDGGTLRFDVDTQGDGDFTPLTIPLSMSAAGVDVGGTLKANGDVEVGGRLQMGIIHVYATLSSDPPVIGTHIGSAGTVVCAHSGWPNPSYTDCTCPAGYKVMSGGALTVAANHYIRETRAHSSGNAWRVGCGVVSTGAAIHCSVLTIACVRMAHNP